MNINTSTAVAAYSPATQSRLNVEDNQAQDGYVAQAAQAQAAAPSGSGPEPKSLIKLYAIPAWEAQFSVFLNGLGQNPLSAREQALKNANPQDLEQLHQSWREHAGKVYADNGLTDLRTRYKAISENPELNTELHRQFNQLASADPQLLAALNRIGIDLLPMA